MLVRRCFSGLSGVGLALGLALVIVGCGNPQGLDSIQVTPTTQTLAVGQTTQFTATGIYGNANHASTQNITDGVTWSSSTPSVATVSASGLATAVGAGTTTITASAAGFAGPVTSSATLSVTSSGGGVAGGSIVSISIIPSSQTVSAPGQTSQFIAIGTTSSGATVNVSSQVTWSSSSATIATVGATSGLATAVGQGTTTITALYTNTSGGTVVTGNATFNVSGGTTEKYTGVSITPSSQALSASGQTTQLVALGTSGATGLLTDVSSSSQIKWVSTSPSIATVSATGVVTGVSAGTDTVIAELTNADGTVVTGTATLSVAVTPAPEPLLSLTIIPSSISVGNLQGTGQFLAIGTYSTPPYVRDVTNLPTTTWISSFPNDFPVDTNSAGGPGATAGIVTAYASGSATIIAETKAPDNTIQTATATFNCPLALPNPNGDPPTPGSCITTAPGLLQTLTVYNEGLNTTNWLVTAPSASGTPNVIHCGGTVVAAGNSVCVATYPILSGGTPVVLTAPAEPGVAFGGWSYNCTPNPVIPNPVGPNTCTITISPSDTQVTVGAIFN